MIGVFETGYTVDVNAADGNIAVIITDKEMGNPFRISGTIAEMTDDKIQEAIDELIEAVKHVRTNKAAWLEEAKRKVAEEAREEARKAASKSSKDKKDDKKDTEQKSMFDDDSVAPAKTKTPDAVKEAGREATNEETQKIIDKTKDLIPKPEQIKEQKPKGSIPIVGAKTKPEQEPEPEPEIPRIPDNENSDDEGSPFIGGSDSDNDFTPQIPGDDNDNDDNSNEGSAEDNPFSVSSWV